MLGPNIRTEVETNADGTHKSIKSSVKESAGTAMVSAFTSKLSDTVITKGWATTIVDIGLFYGGSLVADYMQNKKLRLNPYAPYVPQL